MTRWMMAMWLAFTMTLAAAELKLELPLKRAVYQTNERIDFTVLRPAASAGELTLTLTDEAGSVMSFVFPTTRAVEHLHVDGSLLRPGKYAVAVADGAATAKTDIEVFSHIRRSSYRLVNWGRATKPEQQIQEGEAGFGYNVFYAMYAGDPDLTFMKAGVDVIPTCVMSGGHQMDLRLECDWSDPYVTRGGTQRVVARALLERTRGNVPGIHFYDEPGLTWFKDPVTGQMTAHGIPAQVRSFESAFGYPPPDANKLDPKNPADVAAWSHWANWKLGFMDSAWKEAKFGVNYVRPDYLAVNQSQYAWYAFTDGYYFNVVRSLSVISGHGGYDDGGLGYFTPSYYLEMARARDLTRDCWYLPTWYGGTTGDMLRLEHYLSFQTGIEGMITPPDLDPALNPIARDAITECNHVMARLGTIFNTMPVTRSPVAMLYSMSDNIATQTVDRALTYASGSMQGQCLGFTYLAGKMLQQPFMPVVDEDVVDGTLATNHKAVILSSVRYLDPAVVKALEDFAAGGGHVWLVGDCTVKIAGAINLNVPQPKLAGQDSEEYKKLAAESKWGELMSKYMTVTKCFEGAEPLVKALKAQLDKAGIKPVFVCDQPGISATRQAEGDIEYVFAVNATPDPAGANRNSMKATSATIALEDRGRPVYDAMQGGAVKAKDKYEFSNGQMRVFALTARPIGGVRVATPVVAHDLTLAKDPIRLQIAATMVDDKGGVLSGSAPLRIRVVDSKGATRYDLYRATKLGTLQLELPLAVNDPAGSWKVVVTELLNNSEATVAFDYQPLTKCGGLAGTERRAAMWVGEVENLFRFARINRSATIVTGSSDYNAAAAERVKKILDPWGVKCTIMSAADANKPRSLTEEEAKSWIGLAYTGSGNIKPGAVNSPVFVGLAVEGAVILLGTPEDNPLIKFLQDANYLPYKAKASEFPGNGRGYVAWQRDGVGKGQESVTLIGYDADGLSEAVGSLYEAVAGIEPLTRWKLASTHSIKVK